MIIRYKHKRLRWNVVFGLFWVIIGVISISANPVNYLNYGYIIAGLLYFGNFIVKSTNQYVTIENGIISLNYLIPKKIHLNELTQIKSVAGDYILKTEKTELRIKTRLIEKNSLKELKKVLNNLNLKK